MCAPNWEKEKFEDWALVWYRLITACCSLHAVDDDNNNDDNDAQSRQ